MAYLTYLASVSAAEVVALRADPAASLAPSLVVTVSHLIAYWVQVQPLGQLLGRAIDGGAALHGELWHPLRSPCYHDPQVVQSLVAELAQAWQEATATEPIRKDDWYRIEIEKVLRVFRHAAERGECVVSALQPPADRERADRVRVPIVQ